jgi:hypothetical protein
MDEHCGNCEHGPESLCSRVKACGMSHWEASQDRLECAICRHMEEDVDAQPCIDCRPTGWAAKGEGDEDASS